MLAVVGWTWSADAHALQQPSPIAGSWSGQLETVRLTIVFHISAGPDGKFTATMDSPDQGVTGIPVSQVTYADSVLKLVVAAVQGEYEGRLGADSTLTGQWRQGAAQLGLVLKKGAPAARKPRPQEPVAPLPYDVEEVRIGNSAANVELAGTFTKPRGGGRHPAVVLISGSGPQDRDESLLGHKPFLVLADHLTRSGIAVVRYDDRGFGKSTGRFATATSVDFMGDALAAVAWLKSRPEVDPSAIGLVGHSEGGLIAPMAAVRSPDVRYIVMLAGPGVTGEEILYEQGRLIAKAAGTPDAVIAENVAMQRRLFQIVKEVPDTAQSRARIRSVMRAALDSLTETERAAMGVPGDVNVFVEGQTQQVTSPWFRAFLLYDPATSLERVSVPVLALNGELDLQVPPDQSLPAIEQALKRAGNTDVTLKRLPGLNHLFQHATTGAPSEYERIEETFSPEALDLISTWIRSRTSASR
jgi:pimeloyl-ACP methyl ester carboxylesterase